MEFLDLFKAYESGEMNRSQRISFENRLNEDPVFKEEFQLFQIQNLMVDAAIERDLNQQVSELWEENKGFLDEQLFDKTVEKKVVSFWRNKKIIQIAAAVFLLIGIGFFLNKNQTPDIILHSSKVDLIAKEIDPNLYVFTGTKSAISENEAFIKNKKLLSSSVLSDVESSIKWFENESIHNYRLKYYKAQGLFKTKKYDASAQFFKEFLGIAPQSDVLFPKAEVFEILALFAGGNTKEVSKKINLLITNNSKHPFENILLDIKEQL